MKLAEIAECIPEGESFVVEEYNDNHDMTYGWFVDTGARRENDLASVKAGAYHEEVISIHSEPDEDRVSILVIEVRYSPKKES